MSEQSQLNFNIPKIKRQLSKDNLRIVSLTSRDATELLQATERCYLDQDIRGQWEVKAIQIFDNRELEKAYREKRTELKDDGRHARELVEQYAFLYVKDTNAVVPSIARNGLRTKPGSFSGLGDSKSGVYVCKHPDVQLKLADQREERTVSICVFKVTLGRCKAQQMSSSPDIPIEPTPNYDSHVSASAAQTNSPHPIQLQRSQIYLYEYTDEALPSERPRHCLPYALLQYEKKESSSSSYGQYSRSSYGTKSTGTDYSWKSSQWKPRGDVSSAPRRSSYETIPTFARSDSLTGQSSLPSPLMMASTPTYKIPSGREDPRIARKRNSTEKMDISVDPRQTSDLRLAQSIPRMLPNDPRMLPTDPRLMASDPRIASSDPRLVQGDPRVGQRISLPTGPYGNIDMLSHLKPDQKTISPEMKSMIKTVEQLWGTTSQDETAITSEDQAGNSIVKQVQEQMEQKKAEAKEKRKKISLSDYSTRRIEQSLKSNVATSSVPTITSVPVPTVPVTAVDVLPDLTTVTTATECVPSVRVDPDKVTSSFTKQTAQIFPPSRFSQSGQSAVSPVKTITSPVVAPSAVPGSVPAPAPVPAPVPPPTAVSTTSQSSFPTPPVLPPIVPYPMSAPPAINFQSDTDTPKDSIAESTFTSPVVATSVSLSAEVSVASVSDATGHTSLQDINITNQTGSPNVLSMSKDMTIPYSPKGSADYKDPYAAVKKSIQLDFTKPAESPTQRSPVTQASLSNPFGREPPKTSTAPEPDVKESPVKKDLSRLLVTDPQPSSVVSTPEYVQSQLPLIGSAESKPLSLNSTVQSRAEVQSQPMPTGSPLQSRSMSGVQPQPLSVGSPGQPTPIAIGSPASVLPQSPVAGSSIPMLGISQQQGSPKDPSQAYVKDLVSKFQSLGDIKDIISKMGLKGTVTPNNSVTPQPLSSVPTPQVERYREIGSTFSLPVSDTQPQEGFQDVDQRQQRFMDINQGNIRHDDLGYDSWRSSPRGRGSRFSQSGYSDTDHDERYRGGSKHDDFWSYGQNEDVDFRRRDDRRYRYEDSRRAYDSRYDRRPYVRRDSPRHEDACKYGDFDYRSSRYHSPRRVHRNSNSENERRDLNDPHYEDWRRKSSSGDGDDFRVVDEYICSDMDDSSKSGFEQGGEKLDDLGVWMAPRIEGGEMGSDIEMTPVKESSVRFEEDAAYFTSDRGFDGKSPKRSLFSPKGRKTGSEHEDASVASLSSPKNDVGYGNRVYGSPVAMKVETKSEEAAAVSQARSWAEVIEQEDQKEKKKITDVDKENKEAQVAENGKKVKKRKVDKVMAGYKKRRKKKKKTLSGKLIDDSSTQRSWSPCPSENFSIEYDNDDIDYADFSFDMPHSYVETIPHSDDDFMSTTTGTTTPTVEESTDKSHLQPRVQLTDFLLVSELTHGHCSMCTDVAQSVKPYVRLLLPGTNEDTTGFKVKEEPKEDTIASASDNEVKAKSELILETFKDISGFKPVTPAEEEAPLPKGTEYYMRNCLPGLDLIVPEESTDDSVHRIKPETKEVKLQEEKVDLKNVKPLPKQEKVEENKIGYNSIEGDRPLHLKFQKSPAKLDKESEKSVEKEVKAEAKSADDELDINGTHNTFNPIKGIMKRKLSITLCVGGKKKKSEIKPSSVFGATTIAHSTDSGSAKTTPTVSTPVVSTVSTPAASTVFVASATTAATAVTTSIPTRSIPTVQYKIGIKKSPASSPIITDLKIGGQPTSQAQAVVNQMSNIVCSVADAECNFPPKRGGTAIPVLGMSRSNVTPQLPAWTPEQTPGPPPSTPKTESSLASVAPSSSQIRWPTTPVPTSLSGQPLVLAAPTISRPPVMSIPRSAFVPPQVPLRQQQSNLNVRHQQPSLLQQFPPRPVQSPVLVPPSNPNLQHPSVPSTRFSHPPPNIQHQPTPTSTGLSVRPQQVPIRQQPPCTLPGQTIPPHAGQPVQPPQSVRPQLPMSQRHGLQHVNTAYPPPPLHGSNQSPQLNYQFPLPRGMVPPPPQGVSNIHVLAQHPQRPPVPHPVQPSVGQSFTPNLPPVQRPLFNPNQPPPVPPIACRPISTLVQVPTSIQQPPPEPKKSSDPAAWFADMFAPKPREPSTPRESTPETGVASPAEKQSREQTPDSQNGSQLKYSKNSDSSNLWAIAFDKGRSGSPAAVALDKGRSGSPAATVSSASASPNTQNPFLAEPSRDAYAGEAVHTGKDTKASHSPSRRVVLKSVVTYPKVRSPAPQSSNERSSSPLHEHHPRDKLCKKPLDVLSKQREEILNALQNLQSSASDSEESHEHLRKDIQTHFERSSSEPRGDRKTPERESEKDSRKTADYRDVRRVEFQIKNERKTISSCSKSSIDDNTSVEKRKSELVSGRSTPENIRNVVRKAAADWSDIISKDKRLSGKKVRETVDYHDELMLELYRSDREKVEATDTPDDSSSVSGDSIEDLEELSSKLGSEHSRDVGPGQKVPLTIEAYLKYKLGVVEPIKVRERIPWPLSTNLSDQTKHKRRRMVQKAKVVAAHYLKKMSTVDRFGSSDKPDNIQLSEEPVEKERKLEDFTKEQILLELQVVQECIQKCMETSQINKQASTAAGSAKQATEIQQMIQSGLQSLERNMINAQANISMHGLGNKTSDSSQSQIVSGQWSKINMQNNPYVRGLNPQQQLLTNNPQVNMGNPQTRGLGGCDDSDMSMNPSRDQAYMAPGSLLSRQKDALQQVASDLMEGFQKLNYMGRIHQKVPDDILLSSEKKKYHSEEGCFLILLSAISKKPYNRLLTMKLDMEKFVKQKMEASTRNQTGEVNRLKICIQKLHEDRKKLLTTFTGSLGKKRLRKLNLVKTKYQVCVSYLKKELGVEALSRLHYIATLHQTINTHVRIVQEELASPTL